jgi:hypothetical protein
MKPIDPIVIKEKQERQQKREHREHATKRALVGLAWFAEYAFGGVTHYEGDEQGGAKAGTGIRQVNPDTLVAHGPNSKQLIVASSTPGVDAAAHYVNQAFLEARKGIVERAIELAQADLDANEVTERSS